MSRSEGRAGAGPGSYFGRDLEAMSQARNYHRWILGELRPFLGERLVEVGAGCGNFTPYLLEAAPRWVVAVEPSANMFELLVQSVEHEPRVRPVHGFLGDAAGACPEPPDTLVYVNVLEHVEADRRELARAREVLGARGRLCVLVPALPALYGSFDRAVGHVRRYRKSELEDKVRRAGFRVVRSRYFDLPGALAWWVVYKLLRSGSLGAGQVSLYDRLVVPLARRVEAVWSPPIGKNVLLVAEKAAG